MTHATPEHLLAFSQGVLSDDLAAEVAVHLDGCPRCAARVAAHDPLAAALEAVPDPPLPRDVVAAALVRADAPEPSPRTELTVGAALLAAAALLFLWLDDPIAWATRAGVVARALTSAAGAVAPGAAYAGAAATAALLVVLSRFALDRRGDP